MSTIEEFENAPVGATATTPDGKRAVKTFNTTSPWRTELDDWHGYTMSNANMPAAGYTLDFTTLTTASEALDMAWNLAHEVTEGQIIPEGTRYLQWVEGNLREYTEHHDMTISKGKSIIVRTLDPLPNH